MLGSYGGVGDSSRPASYATCVYEIELGSSYCALCVKRPISRGGRAGCPISEPQRSVWQSKPDVAHGCPAFVPGENVRYAELADPLFDGGVEGL